MKITPFLAIAGLVMVSSCSGSSTTASPDSSFASTSPVTEQTLANPQTTETVPALLDPSTDIDAIDMPVVLWFWSPG